MFISLLWIYIVLVLVPTNNPETGSGGAGAREESIVTLENDESSWRVDTLKNIWDSLLRSILTSFYMFISHERL